ncbi:MAG TPA: LysM domain-containing protein [Anaerolineales bacterium]|nr:LysM domain-containing protein [Anaerolineales bacterium]
MSPKRIVQLSLILVMVMASLAFTENARAHSWCGSTYVVQRGDWLAKIARNCGVTLSSLRAYNPWTYDQRYIYPGQVLAIPEEYMPPPGDPPPAGGPGSFCGPNWDLYGGYWYVCRGDTLGRIARYYGVSWRYLQSVNGIPNANRIYPGQVIRP